MGINDQPHPPGVMTTLHQNYHFCRMNDEIVAAIYRDDYGYWQIVITRDGADLFVVDEYYYSVFGASIRAVEILWGAKCDLKPEIPEGLTPPPRDSTRSYVLGYATTKKVNKPG